MMTSFVIKAALLLATAQLTFALGSNLVCYYDAKGSQRQGLSQFSIADLETALQFCTHVVYGYVGIDDTTFEVKSLREQLDIQQRHFASVTALKERHPDIKFLLSVGGDVTPDQTESYVKLLEAGRGKQRLFIESARDLVRRYNFDGLDLAFQMPRNKPRKVHSSTGLAWKKFKKFFTGDFIVDEKADDHKEAFTDLVMETRNAFRPNELMLTLTVLPNVNSSWYYDAPAIINNLDFVNLAAFDFLTPQRNPEEADYTAALYEPAPRNDDTRLGHYNVNFQVEYWLLQRVPANKIIVGISSVGRSWRMTTNSGPMGLPIVQETAGPAPAGPQTKTEGMLNWAEICMMLPNPANAQATGANAPIKRIADPFKRVNSYSFRKADENGEHGIWVSHEDPDTAASKAGYVKSKSLGGVALFDLTQDDFRGQCTNDKYPILRAIKYRLL